MNVLLDTSPLLNQNRIRGVGTYTEELLAALQELNITPEPFIVHASHEASWKNGSEFDLIHYPYFDLFFATLPRKKNQPVVVTVHDVIPLIFPEHYPVGLKGRLRFWQQKHRLDSADAVITDSECSKKDIVTYLGISEAKIFVVPLAARRGLVAPSEYLQQKVKQELDLPQKFGLYIGDINYNKNLPTLLLALTQLPDDIHLCVVSATFHNKSIPEGKILAEIIRDNSLSDRVHVLSVPKEATDTLSAVIALSKCLVQPSLYEGFGLPVLEAMQVGTVVVSSNGGSLPEVVGEAAIVVDPTITGLADGISKAVALRGEDRERWVKAGRQRAEMFSWRRTAELTYAVYEMVLRSSSGGKHEAV